jgi:hypothetical protein
MRVSQKKIILILGMHRSGTSACARLVNLAGIDLGEDLMVADVDNPRGFFEDAEVVGLNDAILAACGGHWYTASTLAIDEFSQTERGQALRRSIGNLLDRRLAHRACFGIKDPRLCRTLPMWRQVALQKGIGIESVQIYRNPLEVAASLHTRNRLPLEHALDLWLRYNLEGLLHTRGLPRELLSFDALINHPVESLRQLAALVRPAAPLNEMALQAVSGFVDHGLRHAHHSPDDLYSEAVRNSPALALFRALENDGISAEFLVKFERENRHRLLSERRPWLFQSLRQLHRLLPYRPLRHRVRHWLYR